MRNTVQTRGWNWKHAVLFRDFSGGNFFPLIPYLPKMWQRDQAGDKVSGGWTFSFLSSRRFRMFWKGRTVFPPPICLFNSPFRETQSILFLSSLLLLFFILRRAITFSIFLSASLLIDRLAFLPTICLSLDKFLFPPFPFPFLFIAFFLPGKCHFPIYSVWQTSEANLFFSPTPQFPNTHGLELFEGWFTTSQC